MHLLLQVLQDEVPLPPAGSISEQCRDFLTLCLARDPARRPPAAALLGHPWIAQAAPVNIRGLLGQLGHDPDDRCEGSAAAGLQPGLLTCLITTL
jgi:serine/threonine protein kinase